MVSHDTFAIPGSTAAERREENQQCQGLRERPCSEARHVLSLLIFTTSPCGKYDYPHFTEEETASQRS